MNPRLRGRRVDMQGRNVMGVDKKDDQTDVNPNQKDGDEILRRMLKTLPKSHEKPEKNQKRGAGN